MACCALPALIAAGLLGGAAAGVAAWMPTAAIILAVASVAVFVAGHLRARRRNPGHGCAFGACGCADGREADVGGLISGTVVRLQVAHLPSGGEAKPVWLWWSKTDATVSVLQVRSISRFSDRMSDAAS
ncbi:hypothetical protein [Embleya sp. NPDC005575]|uniref:hypothetical protein n=1 Tax=Embleya sp. NPDC005575 TaxID=3156892 RepID=UPI0033B668F6